MKSSRRLIVVLHILRVSVCLSLAVANLYADVIYLNDGNVLLVEKAWIEGDEVKYETSRGVRSVPKSMVREIQTENLPPPSPSAKKWSLESVVDESGTNLLKATPSTASGNAVSSESLTRLRQNLSTNPADPRAKSDLIQALNSVAWLQLTQGDLPAARTSLEEALNLNTRDAAIASNLAVVHLRMGNYRAAEDLLKAAINLDRNNQETHYLLGATYYGQEKIDLAIDEWTAGLRLGPHPEMSRSLDKAQKEARVHDQLGELQSTHFILRYDQKVYDQRLSIARCGLAFLPLCHSFIEPGRAVLWKRRDEGMGEFVLQRGLQICGHARQASRGNPNFAVEHRTGPGCGSGNVEVSLIRIQDDGDRRRRPRHEVGG